MLKKFYLMGIVFLAILTIFVIPVSALQATPFEQWFPLPISIGSVWMLLVTILLVMSGTVAGITIKELQTDVGNPKSIDFLSHDNKRFIILGGALTIGFWISNVPALDCFLWSTGIKAALGTLRNYMDKKKIGT